MGEEMTREARRFVSFEPAGDGFVGFASIELAVAGDEDPEVTLRQAVAAYSRSVAEMRSLMGRIAAARQQGRVPARLVWDLGDSAFRLDAVLSDLGLQLDGLYAHLCRDLGVKRKWLEKALTFRRHAPDAGLVATSLNWGQFAKGTRRAARALCRRASE
ncbi:MAG: hypothetical protein HY321_17865 [Armatimonadetes bacterium]|nr:hypothetical protein [Armatimonadota bacterium]